MLNEEEYAKEGMGQRSGSANAAMISKEGQSDEISGIGTAEVS